MSAGDSMSAGLIPHNRLTFDDQEVRAVEAVVRSGYWAGGPQVAELEQALCRCAGIAHAVGVGSGLAALRLALKALGVSPGDKVLVPAYSCVAVATATLALGAEPIPVEVCPNTWSIDAADARRKLVHQPRAIIAVHTFGSPADIEALKDTGLPVIEDCAHGFGMSIHGRRLGAMGDLAVISFYATKLIGAGEGGAVLTDDQAASRFIRDWRSYVDQPPEATRLNDKMTDLTAALALCQLHKLDALLGRRQELADHYEMLLRPLAERSQAFRLPPPGRDRIWYRYAIEMRRVDAGAMIDGLKCRGIIAEQPVSDWRDAMGPACPVADRAYRGLVSLPLYPTLREEEQDRVCRALECVLKER